MLAELALNGRWEHDISSKAKGAETIDPAFK
jgi:hypothetical protein